MIPRGKVISETASQKLWIFSKYPSSNLSTKYALGFNYMQLHAPYLSYVHYYKYVYNTLTLFYLYWKVCVLS